jgi:hypothetical protein
MPRRPLVFRQADLQRALRAAKAAGIAIERIEIDPASGRIVIVTKGDNPAEFGNPLDDWLAKNARQTQRN